MGPKTYRFSLALSLSRVYPVFHVSMLKKFHDNDNWDSILLDENLSYQEKPIAILDRVVRKLRTKDIASVRSNGRTFLLRNPFGTPKHTCRANIHSYSSI